MGMVKMKHINIYGPEQDPQQTLEVLAKLACFHPDKDAERINAAAGAAGNLYTPLLASTLGLIKDVGGDPALQEYRGRFFEYGAVKDEVEALSAQVAERGKRQAEISAKLATYAQTKTQLYHLTGLHTSVDEIFACNRHAEELTRVSAPLVQGKLGDEVFPYIPFGPCLRDRERVGAQVVRIHGALVSVEVVPVMRTLSPIL